jgi:hypothetical protein
MIVKHIYDEKQKKFHHKINVARKAFEKIPNKNYSLDVNEEQRKKSFQKIFTKQEKSGVERKALR